MTDSTEIGKLGRCPVENPTKEQVITFCDNLKASILQQLELGNPIALEVKHRTEPIYNNYGMVLDHRYMGCRYVIGIGEGAVRIKMKQYLREEIRD